MTAAETRRLAPGTLVYCTVRAVRGWYRLVAVRPRDGYIRIEGYRPWCPPHNFTAEEHA